MRINEENQVLLKRIQAVQAQFDRKKLVREAKRQEKYAKNISSCQ